MFTELDNKFLEELNFASAETVFDKGLDVIKRTAHGLFKPLLTSIPVENKVIGGFYPTDQIVIAARSGIGKSNKALAMIDDFLNPLVNPDYVGKIIVIYNSWDMPAWRNGLKFITKDQKLSSRQLLDYNNRLSVEYLSLLDSLKTKYKNYPLFINNRSTTSKTWESNVIKIAERFPNHTIVVLTDHTRLVTSSNHYSEESMISDLMHSGVKVKNQYNTINIFLSQLNRNIELNAKFRSVTGTVGNTLPVTSDIFGSDAVQQTSDIVLSLHRPGYYGERYFKGEGITIDTELSDAIQKNDKLIVQSLLKGRYSSESIMFIRGDLSINEFREYTLLERQKYFKQIDDYEITN